MEKFSNQQNQKFSFMNTMNIIMMKIITKNMKSTMMKNTFTLAVTTT